MFRFIFKNLFVLAVFLSGYMSAGENQKIHLIWQFEEQHRCEEDWIMELLSGVDVDVVSDGNYNIFLDKSIVIVSYFFGREHHRQYFETLRNLNYDFAIIYLSDEAYMGDTDFYPYAKFVLRSYWHEKFLGQDNVHILPLGYKAGFWREGVLPQIKPLCERPYTWCFAGQINNLPHLAGKPTRQAMIDNLKTIPGYHIHETMYWGDPNGLNAIEYRNLLLDSMFSPCPAGFWNIDSFRQCESLECGCIPIVERGKDNYYDRFFGKHPMIVVDAWDQAPAVIEELLQDPKRLETLQAECMEWWQAYKIMLKAKVKNLVENHFN